MKSVTQLVLLTGILVAIVGGLTFVSHYNTSTRVPKSPTVGPGPEPGGGESIKFLATGTADEQAPEWEHQVRGHRDYWFENTTTNPAEMSLKYQSCTCSDVRVASFSPDEWQELRKRAQSQEAVLVREGDEDPLAGRARWTLLRTEDAKAPDPAAVTTLTVPAADKRPAGGVVRLSWKGDRLGPIRLTAELLTRPLPAGRTALQRLEVPLVFVPPFGVDPSSATVPDLGYRSVERVSFRCFSSTRGDFKLAAEVRLPRETKSDPCFRCTARPLNDLERRALGEKMQSQVRCGYDVTVTIHERVEGAQLDLGPFQRKVYLTNGSEEVPGPVLTGMVRGEVQVGTPDDKDQVTLGAFPAARGTEKSVWVFTDRPALRLRLDGWTPSYLEVRLEEAKQEQGGGRGRWNLHVKVPPKSLAGAMPAGSAVYLQTQGDPPRRIRIPVTGIAAR
jgi:hypothetical protein